MATDSDARPDAYHPPNPHDPAHRRDRHWKFGGTDCLLNATNLDVHKHPAGTYRLSWLHPITGEPSDPNWELHPVQLKGPHGEWVHGPQKFTAAVAIDPATGKPKRRTGGRYAGYYVSKVAMGEGSDAYDDIPFMVGHPHIFRGTGVQVGDYAVAVRNGATPIPVGAIIGDAGGKGNRPAEGSPALLRALKLKDAEGRDLHGRKDLVFVMFPGSAHGHHHWDPGLHTVSKIAEHAFKLFNDWGGPGGGLLRIQRLFPF